MKNNQQCQFCGNPGTLLCDGKIYDNGGLRARVPYGNMNFLPAHISTCDAKMCRACAKKVSDVHFRMKGGCRWDTVDLCPDCQKAQEKPVLIVAQAEEGR